MTVSGNSCNSAFGIKVCTKAHSLTLITLKRFLRLGLDPAWEAHNTTPKGMCMPTLMVPPILEP